MSAPTVSEIEQELLALHQEHAAALLRYAVLMARSPDLGRDGVQEAFLRYFVERKYGRPIENPRAWLYRVLRNHMLDQIKSVTQTREVVLANLEQLVDAKQDPERAMVGREMAQEIAAALTLRELDCLRLRAEGLGYAEIGEVLGIRTGTVGALLARVHKKLRAGSDSGAQRRQTADAVHSLFQEAKDHSS